MAKNKILARQRNARGYGSTLFASLLEGQSQESTQPGDMFKRLLGQ